MVRSTYIRGLRESAKATQLNDNKNNELREHLKQLNKHLCSMRNVSGLDHNISPLSRNIKVKQEETLIF
jgi:hypothetical protein